MIRIFLSILILAGSVDFLIAQDLGQSEKSDLSFRGGIRLYSQIHQSNNTSNFRTNPFSYGVSANLAMSIGKFNLPFSFVYRDNSINISRPFFYLGASPKLGLVQFHLGNRSLNFSQYTLGGTSFFGVGAELKQGKLRLSAMAGSFRNPFAQRDSIIFGSIELPTFDRKGYSLKLGVGSDKNYIDLIYLRVKDQVDEALIVPTNQFTPKDNSVLGLNIVQNLGPSLRFKLDAAASAITPDLTYDTFEIENASLSRFSSVIEVNPTSYLSFAGDAEIQLRLKNFKTSFLYRRVYPNYLSLGSIYLNPDREEYLIKFSGSLLKNRIRINSSFGWQNNNLLNQSSFVSNRFIGSTAILFNPQMPFRLNIGYNNYDISNLPTIIEDNDSLQVVRIMNQLRISPTYSIKNDQMTHTISGSMMIRETEGQFAIDRRDTRSRLLSLGYALRFINLNLICRANFSFNRSNNFFFTRDRIGGSLSLAKSSSDKKLSISFTSAYFRNLVDDKLDGNTFRGGAQLRYSIFDNHGIQLSLNHISRNSVVFNRLREIQIRTSYSYAL